MALAMHDKTLAQLADDLAARRVSATELTDHHLERIERLDPQLNAFVTVTRDEAMAQAKAADKRLAAGDATPLTGIPIAHKDLFCTQGVKTSCGSKILDNFISPYDATVVSRLKEAGAVMLGKTNMDEFAMGSSNETSFFGPVCNPWNLECSPGGSSGGSSASVAARFAPPSSEAFHRSVTPGSDWLQLQAGVRSTRYCHSWRRQTAARRPGG